MSLVVAQLLPHKYWHLSHEPDRVQSKRLSHVYTRCHRVAHQQSVQGSGTSEHKTVLLHWRLEQEAAKQLLGET